MIRIACCQYPIEILTDWHHYTDKITQLVIQAKKQKADLLLLPEYAGIEIACKQFPTDHALFDALQPHIGNYLAFYSQLAQTQQLYLQAGTILEKTEPNLFANRAYLFSPNGTYGYQDKLQLTAYEKNTRLIAPGNRQILFHTALGTIGIAVCYDSEFPEIVRQLTSRGATLILVPCYTTSHAGLNRVLLSCRARALENQCYVALSSVVHPVALTVDIDRTYGQAAIVGPCDRGFPDDGIIAQGQRDEATLIIGDIALDDLERARTHGAVHNFMDFKRLFQKQETQTISL